MALFSEYSQSYSTISLQRRDGIIEMRLHSKGGPVKWSTRAHDEMGRAFREIAEDSENRVLIFTGTGDSFIADHYRPTSKAVQQDASKMDAEKFDRIMTSGLRLTNGLLDIGIPVIAAVNGPALIHAELPVICDIVIASSTAEFQDRHFTWGLVPGDGDHAIWSLLLGPNRGRHFLLTAKKLTAQEALQLGVVAEVVAPDSLLGRAWELAEKIAAQPPLTTKYARALFTRRLKKVLADELPYGLALEGLAATVKWIDLVNYE